MDEPNDLGGLRVLVTGAGGMLGARVVRELVDADADVRALDLRRPVALEDLSDRPNLQVIEADVTDTDELARNLKGCDAVVHLAALLRIAAEERPRDAFAVNLAATHDILSYGSELDVRRVVLGSSVGVYGAPASPDHRFVESDDQVGRSFYEVSKIAGELYAEAFARSRGLEYVALRFGTLYGPGMQRTGVIPRLLHDVLAAVDAGDVPLVDQPPGAKFDFLFVDDAARSVRRALTCAETNLPINVVTGQSRTLEEMLMTLLEVHGASSSLRWEPNTSLVPAERHFDASRIAEVLGFVPSTSLRDGLAAFIEWRRQELDRT